MTDKKQNSQEPINRREMLKKEPINRREMLKKGALATGGAITAAAFLDGKWLKPIVKPGILPVHAKASVCGVYTFTARFEDRDDGDYLGVTVSPIGPDGPISYEIMAVVGITLDPGVGSSGAAFLTGGTIDFAESYEFTNTPGTEKVTIKWSYDGCDYTQTYGDEIIEFPPEPEP